jgi:hypothetical protein
MKNFIKILLALLLLFKSVSYSYGQDLTKQQLQAMVDNMLLYKNYHVNIKKLVPAVNGVFAVVLEMPYREFPSIVLMNRDTLGHKWVRVFECLNPGIQNTPSGLEDWHTKGVALDFLIDKVTKVYSFNSEKVKSLVESSFDVKGEVIIPYEKFIHTNTAANANDFIPYTIDKTKYFDFAISLFGETYRNYPAKQCLNYDSPSVNDCKLEQKGGVYTLTVKTSNGQLWLYTFKGIDPQNRYLIDKEITVSKIAK